MEAFLISTGIVAVAEMGDKTQSLAIVLAARFRQPSYIIAGILVATILNHGLAGAVGSWTAFVLGRGVTHWLVGLTFIAMAIWTMTPERPDRARATKPRFGIFATTIVAFFLAEIGDKSQIATIALAARYSSFFAVVAGTTAGMMISNTVAVLVGDAAADEALLRIVRPIGGLIFAALGVMALLNVDNVS